MKKTPQFFEASMQRLDEKGSHMADENNQDKSNANHGGRRLGAGRKPGAATTKTREIADRAAAEGVTPLDVMLKTMRALLDRAEAAAIVGEQVPDSGLTPDLNLLIEASKVAKDAAPYMHPRLQSTTLKGDKDNPLGQWQDLKLPTAEELRKLVLGE